MTNLVTSILVILNVITEITNKYAPLRKLSRKKVKSKTKPWLTKGLLNDVITKQQFGFRCGYSTEMAITYLYNRVVKNRDQGYNSCCLFFGSVKSF